MGGGNSNFLDRGPRSGVCTCEILPSAPHQPEQRFYATHVSKKKTKPDELYANTPAPATKDIFMNKVDENCEYKQKKFHDSPPMHIL